MLKFRKMHGLGNDFVIVDGREEPFALDSGIIQRIADRRLGVGCDQFILILPSNCGQTACFMRIFNPDGFESGACGNATRCVADILMRESGQDECVIETMAGHLTCRRADMNRICVDMGRPRLDWNEIPLSGPCDTFHLPLDFDAAAISMGNPHCVVFVDNLVDFPVEEAGKSLENNSLFPEKTNVEFIQVLEPGRIRMRVWERGVGLTPACGSGACAALVAAVRRARADRRAEVILDGGSLALEWADDDASVLMTGPVSSVFDGIISHDPI